MIKPCIPLAALTCFLLLCCTILTPGQTVPSASQNNSSITIRGKIIDAATSKLLSYAHVGILNRGLGTISNSSGEFVLTIPIGYQSDTIKASFVGYEPAYFPIRNLSKETLIIALIERTQQLKEVVVKPIDPRTLIELAIRRIPQNYGPLSHRLRGFYRLTSRKYQDFIHISEAIFDLYMAGDTRQNNQFKLIKARAVKDLTPFNGIDNVVFGLKPEGVFKYDLVHTIGESDILSRKNVEKHNFQFNGEVPYNGTQAYEIVFDQKPGIKESLYSGKFYIDTHTMAFLSFTYWLSPKGIAYWKVKDLGQRALMNLLDIHEHLQKDSVQIMYQKFGSRYYLHHVTNNSLIAIKSGRYQFDFPALTQVNYLITEIDTNSVKPFESAALLGESKYIEFQSSTENDYFWQDYNVILPEAPYEKMAQSIQLRNKELSYKNEIETLLRKYPKSKVSRIDSILSFYFRKGLFNGSVLVKHQGEIIFNKGYGIADRKANVANQPQTMFRIGSMTKSFTAMLILQLVQAQKLSLDDPVKKFLPGYIHGGITLKQLLTHQSGIPNYTNNAAHLSKILTHPYATLDLVYQFCSDSLAFKAGTQFDYSNSGYLLLSAIIEKVTGISFGEALDQKIFKPLDMHHTFFGSPQKDVPFLAKGYEYGQPEMQYPLENVAGAGGSTSTTEDLALWDAALYTEVLLRQSVIEELFKPYAPYKDWGAYYGLGWMIDHHLFGASRKHKIVYHPGTDFGFYSMLLRQPDEQNAIILLNNTGDFPRFEISDLLLNVLN